MLIILAFDSGALNNLEGRRLFDITVRDTFFLFVHKGIILPEDCSVFEIVLNLEESVIQQAKQMLRGEVIQSKGIPDRLEDSHFYAEITSKPGLFSENSTLTFHSPTTRAVRTASLLVHSSGGNVMLFGPSGSGKSFLINSLLEEISGDTSSPLQMRQETVANLMSTC